MPGALPLTEQTTTWPNVIGIVAIILSILGLLGTAVGLVFTSKWMQPSSPFPLARLTYVTSGVLEILLLVVGIGLLKRCRWSIKTAMVWAVAAIIVAVLNSVLGYSEMEEQLGRMAQDPNTPPGMGGMTKGAGCIGMGLGTCASCAFPLFVLVWFLRAKIRAEVSTWK